MYPLAPQNFCTRITFLRAPEHRRSLHNYYFRIPLCRYARGRPPINLLKNLMDCAAGFLLCGLLLCVLLLCGLLVNQFVGYLAMRVLSVQVAQKPVGDRLILLTHT